MIRKGELVLFTDDFYMEFRAIGRALRDIDEGSITIGDFHSRDFAGEVRRLVENGDLELLSFCQVQQEYGRIELQRWDSGWDAPLPVNLGEVE